MFPLVSLRKKFAVFLVAAICFVSVAHAILPAFAAAWLISGTNMLIADLVAAQTAVISGVLWYECNGFTSLSGCKSSSQSSINPNSVSSAVSGTANTVPLQVKLNPDSTRSNPDPTKWNSASGGSRDPTPKSSYSAAPAAPGNGSIDAVARAGVGTFTYSSNSGATVTQYDVIQTYQPSMSQVSADAAAKTATAAAHAGWSWSSGIYVTSTDWRSVWYRTTSITCPAGYVVSGSSCVLTDASQVVKPAGTKCEVLYSAASQSFTFDSANPTCTGLESLVSGGVLSSPSTSTGDKLSVKPTSNGGFNICDTLPDGSWNCVQTGPYSPSAGGYPATGSSSGNGGTAGDSGNSGSGNSGSGSGSGSGSSGTGTGSCGGAGQVPCSINGDGIDGKSFDPSASNTGIDNAHKGVIDAIKSNMPASPTWSWVVPISPVACTPLALKWRVFDFVINWCPFVSVYQQVISFLAYVFTAFSLFEIAMRPASRG